MRRLALALAVLLALPALAAVETTTVIFNVVNPGSVTATSGTVTAVLNTSGTADDGLGGTVSVATRTSANIASDGSVALVLVPNDVITPSDTYYTFQYLVRTPAVSSWTELRRCPTSPDPATLADCVRINPPLGATAPMTRVQDEGIDLHSCSKVNFVGGSVAANYSSGTGACVVSITGGSGSGSVESVAISMPGQFTVSNSPVIDAGTIAIAWAAQVQNLVLASPTTTNGVPNFRALVPADVPTLNQSTTGNAATATLATSATQANTALALAVDPSACSSGLYVTDQSASGVLTCAQVAFTQIAGAVTDAQVPNTITVDNATAAATATLAAQATALAANPAPCSAGQYVSDIAADGSVTCSAVAFTQLSGSATDAQIPNTITVDNASQAAALASDPTACTSGLYVTDMSAAGVLTCVQISFSQLANTTNAVTNAMLAQVASGSFKARSTSGTGNYEDLTPAAAIALLPVVVGDSGSGGTKGLVPAPGTGDAAAGKFLNAGGTYSVPPGGSGGIADPGSNGIIKRTALNTTAPAVAGTDYVAPNTAITGATNTKITYDAKGLVTVGAQAAFSDLSGAATDAQVPNTITIDHATSADTATSCATASALAADPAACTSGLFATDQNAAGALTCAQVSFTQLSGAATDAQIPNSITVDNATAAGTAGTATALATNPAACTAGQYVSDVAADGTLTCAAVAFSQVSGAVTDAQVPNTITVDAAAAATALAANGTNCSAGQAAGGVDASGNAEACVTPSGETNVTGDVGAGTVSIRGGTPKSGVTLNLRTFDSTFFSVTSDVLALIAASASTPGYVTTGAQSFAGTKTFTGGIQASDPGNTLRRLGLFGNTSELAGAALPSGAGQISFYGYGTSGSELPRWRTFSGTCSGGSGCDILTSATPSGVTAASYPMADITVDAVGRVTAAADGSTTARTLQNKTIDGGDSGSGTTLAANANIMKQRTHNTDCTTVTDGKQGQLCVDEDDGKIWVCIPGSGDCDSVGEWKRVDASGSSGLSSVVVPMNIASPTSSTDQTFFYTTQPTQVDSVFAQLKGSSQSVTWDLVYARTANASTTGSLGTSGTASIGAAGNAVSIASSIIPKDNYVRLKASAASGTNTNLFAQVAYSSATTTQCNDGIDNDSVNGIDYPADGGCSSPSDTTEASGDSTAPEAISSLSAGSPASTTCLLSWTAPHEDGASGGAVASYDCRVCLQSTCSTTMDNTEFGSATALTGEPGTPASPGTGDSFTATGLTAGTSYVFACKSSDEVPNTSSISNSATCTTSSFSDILFWFNGETGADTDGDYDMTLTGATKECSSGDSDGDYNNDGNNGTTDSGGGAIDVNGAAALVGSQGLRVQGDDSSPGNWDYMQFVISSGDIFDGTSGCVGSYVKQSTAGSQTVFRTSGGTGSLQIAIVGGDIYVDFADGTVTRSINSTGGTFNSAATVFWEVCYDAGTEFLQVRTRTGGTTSSYGGTVSAFAPMTGQTGFLFGNANAGAAFDALVGYVDQLMISDSPTRDLIAIRDNTACPR